MASITIRSPLDRQNAFAELMKLRASGRAPIDPDVMALTEALEHYSSVTRVPWSSVDSHNTNQYHDKQRTKSR